jgi:uncharacterized protein YcnI
MFNKFSVALILSTAALISAVTISPASAHISIRPGIDAAGSTTSAVTAGQSGVLNFRVGHGCTEAEANVVDPNTGTSFQGTKWGTHAFSVEIPVVAQGTGTTVPKAQYVPGFKTSLAKNATTGSYTVTWTAISRDFDIPDGPAVNDPTIAANLYADFGVQIKWATDQSGKTVFFKSVQTCIVDIPGKKVDHRIRVGKNGRYHTEHKTVVEAATTHLIYNSWDVTDGSGADTIPDDTEHNTAPSVIVK